MDFPTAPIGWKPLTIEEKREREEQRKKNKIVNIKSPTINRQNKKNSGIWYDQLQKHMESDNNLLWWITNNYSFFMTVNLSHPVA